MSDLIWQLTKNNNSFLVKKNGVQFSKDPFNLTNRNMFTVSGKYPLKIMIHTFLIINQFFIMNKNIFWSSNLLFSPLCSFYLLGLAQAGAVAITPVTKEAGNASRVDLRFQKRIRAIKETKAAKQNKGKGKVNTVNADLKDNFYTEHVPVKGLHTASRVIT